MKNILFFLLIYLCVFTTVYSQHNHIECGTATPSAEEIELTQKFIKNFQSNVQNLRPSAETVYIPIKLHVVVPDNGDTRLAFFNTKAFNQSLAYTNAVFKKANIEFFITGTINYIKSTKHQNLTINSTDFVMVDGYSENRVEQELCVPHEIPNAINLFVVNNLNVNGAALTNYAKLPNTTSITKLSSYRILMNGLSMGGYGDLKSPVLAHELGHHFSLHHPFDAIGGKELVKRGAGSNCETAGDLVCDTPADPHNEVSNADKLLCGDLPPNYKDANGDIYKPDMTNIMTYYSNFCKNTFTTGQYERILAGLALRKSNTQFGKYDAPDTQVTAPTITGINSYNGGYMYLFIQDNSTNETGFIIERSTAKDGEYVAIGGVAENITRFSDEQVGFDSGITPTYFYRVRPSNSKSAYSNVFEVKPREKFNCIPATNIKCGETNANMIFRSVKATGSTLNETYVPCFSPSNYTYSNSKAFTFQANIDYFIEGTVQNDIQAYHNIYAWIDKNRNGTFDSNERIYATNFTAINRPPDKNFKFTLSTKDLVGNYVLRLRFGFVTDLRDACAGVQQGETIDYVISVLGAYSIRAGDIANNSICPNTSITVPYSADGNTPNSDNKLTIQLSDAQGNNFKDLTTTVEGTNLKATIPANTTAGTGYKVRIVSSSPVSQSVSASVLTIKPLPTATFDLKETTIQQYQSADVKLTLTGDLPIKLKLFDNQSFDLNDLKPTIKLTPNETTEYKISSVSNVCGEGIASANALKITVTPVLGVDDEILKVDMDVFPNPSAELITVKFNNFKKATQQLELIDNRGVVLFKKKVDSEEETIDLKGISSGIYFIRIMDGKQVLSRRIVKLGVN